MMFRMLTHINFENLNSGVGTVSIIGVCSLSRLKWVMELHAIVSTKYDNDL